MFWDLKNDEELVAKLGGYCVGVEHLTLMSSCLGVNPGSPLISYESLEKQVLVA